MNEPIQEGKLIYVFQLPIRIWYWSMVLPFLVFIPTGYTIGKPRHPLDGDPTYLFYMGYTRMAYFIVGFIITVGLLWRIISAFFGNKYSRQVLIIPFWRKSWRLSPLSNFRWYLFFDRTPREHIGHNPLAQLDMMTCINLLIIMILTGSGMYAQSPDSVVPQLFHLVVDFIYWTGDGGRDLYSYHRLGILLLTCFIIIHSYMVIREEVMGKSTLVSTMFSGSRLLRSGKGGQLWNGLSYRGLTISPMGMKASVSGSRNGSIRGMPLPTT